jgi:class 3 adenylate cyclase
LLVVSHLETQQSNTSTIRCSWLFPQVFTLLETIFAAFDAIAKQRRIFKVETVGDCYVAAAGTSQNIFIFCCLWNTLDLRNFADTSLLSGVPDPRPNHAVAMARFARDCVHKMGVVTRDLELTVGPDTGELGLRVGIHSGPVTAGVLRGERSRFQLFGESRLESTGLRGKIHLSQETAELLVMAGKTSWVIPRDDVVIAKGKGELKTFWLNIGSSCTTKTESSHTEGALFNDEVIFEEGPQGNQQEHCPDRTSRLVRWNVDILMNVLREMDATRDCQPADASEKQEYLDKRTMTVLEEVEEIITLSGHGAQQHRDPSSIRLDSTVEEQLVK